MPGWHHRVRRAVAGVSGAGDGYVAKSIIVECADNWGDANFLGIRAIDFFLADVLIDIDSGNLTGYATSKASASFNAEFAFYTALSKIGNQPDLAWVSGSGQTTNQRLIGVFGSPINFDKIVVNNSHSAGTDTDTGAENVKIYTSSNAITDTTYGAAIPNSTLIYDGVFREHVASDQADPETLVLIP